jgi:EKC/KEOPS complex subunit PCC1/LAGE3
MLTYIILQVRRVLEVEGAVLHVRLRAEEARSLRVSLNSFMEHLILATETIRQFGPPK